MNRGTYEIYEVNKYILKKKQKKKQSIPKLIWKISYPAYIYTQTLWWKLQIITTKKFKLWWNIIIFPGLIFLSKNTEKNTEKCRNNKIYQQVVTHTLMGMIQWIYVLNLKRFWCVPGILVENLPSLFIHRVDDLELAVLKPTCDPEYDWPKPFVPLVKLPWWVGILGAVFAIAGKRKIFTSVCHLKLDIATYT